MQFSEKTLSQIVSDYPFTVSLLEKHDLDYCCRGKQTLRMACESDEKLETLEEQLLILVKDRHGNSPDVNYHRLSASELVKHILDRHHHYVKNALPIINGHLQKIKSKHGGRHPELNEINSIFSLVTDEMYSHMNKEELILFPAIIKLQELLNNGEALVEVEKLETPLRVMEMEHETVGDLLFEIRRLSDKYSPPSDACMTYKLSFEELKEFEEDLHRHVHLENNILFPKIREHMQFDKPLS